MAKKLKKWNGMGHGKYTKYNLNVAAYSQIQAANLISQVCERPVSTSEIREHYSPCWGNDMANIIPSQPCVYLTKLNGNPPYQLI